MKVQHIGGGGPTGLVMPVSVTNKLNRVHFGQRAAGAEASGDRETTRSCDGAGVEGEIESRRTRDADAIGAR